MRTILILASSFVFFISGCEDPNRRQTISEIDRLRGQNKALTVQAKQAQKQAEQLTKQVRVLSVVKDDISPEDIYNVEKIRISRFTNFYDKDDDGKKETLVVYIQPTDVDGDSIKAAGAVEVQLWDLSREQQKALVGQWQIKGKELKSLWFTSWISANYTLSFDVSSNIETFEEPLTVKVTFTDYLTGKVFNEQKVIKP